MTPYEDCREPPRLHLLDKYVHLTHFVFLLCFKLVGNVMLILCGFFIRFDIDGPGSCLKRYSDPTHIKRASRSSKLPEIKVCFRGSISLNYHIVEFFFIMIIVLLPKLVCMKQKKKSLQRNRDISSLASIANQSDRYIHLGLTLLRYVSYMTQEHENIIWFQEDIYFFKF